MVCVYFDFLWSAHVTWPFPIVASNVQALNQADIDSFWADTETSEVGAIYR